MLPITQYQKKTSTAQPPHATANRMMSSIMAQPPSPDFQATREAGQVLLQYDGADGCIVPTRDQQSVETDQEEHTAVCRFDLGINFAAIARHLDLLYDDQYDWMCRRVVELRLARGEVQVEDVAE